MAGQRTRSIALDPTGRCLAGLAWGVSAAFVNVPAAHARQPVDFSELGPLTIISVLAVIAALVGLMVHLTPTKRSGVSDEAQAFWRGLSRPGESYLGVLYDDAELHWARWYAVRRIRVTLKHRDPARDEIIHHEDTVHSGFSLFPRIDRAAALACWLETAHVRGLPAVYRRKGMLHTLPPDQVQAACSDPEAFSVAFLKH
ncbi:MAG: hypothetical protein ACR2PO_12920, partial [Methyloligellaceae bacterium]